MAEREEATTPCRVPGCDTTPTRYYLNGPLCATHGPPIITPPAGTTLAERAPNQLAPPALTLIDQRKRNGGRRGH